MLEGKVAIITSGASGIDKVTAKLCSKHGAKVIIVDIQPNRGQTITKQFTYIHCDVTKESDMKNAVDFTIRKYGRLDIMYKNVDITVSLQYIVPLWTDDVAEVAIYLGSDGSKYVSELNLVVDGGYSKVNLMVTMAMQGLRL